MDTKKTNTIGSIKVSVDVILKIAETAATEIDGVACVGQKLLLSPKNAGMRGAVSTKISGETASIKLRLGVLEGHNAVTVSERVQKNVKSAVQNMTGFTVTKVDVEITDVQKKKEN